MGSELLELLELLECLLVLDSPLLRLDLLGDASSLLVLDPLEVLESSSVLMS